MPTIARTGRIECFDLDAHREAGSVWQVRFDQLSPGPFRSQIEYVRAGGLMFYRQHWNRRMHVTGASPAGYLAIGATASPESHVTWQGDELGPGYLAFSHPSEEIEFWTARTSDQVVLLVPPGLLRRHLGEESSARILAAHHGLEWDPRIQVNFVHRIGHLIGKYLANDAPLADKQECDAIEAELLNILALGCTAGDAYRDHGTTPERRKALRRAVDYADELQRPIPVPELATATGASQRTLEYGFEEAFGITPIKYLRWNRMNHMRRELSAAEPGSLSITEAGQHWGFSELGRLAVEYRQLFGELPSATLARCRSPCAERLIDILPIV